MDQTFVKLVEIWERWTNNNREFPALLLMQEIIEYGMRKGLLKDRREQGVENNESDESLMFRAAMGAVLSREQLGEDPGSVLEMTRKQHLKLIRDTDKLGAATIRLCTEEIAALEKKPTSKH